jgi:hypothetical protein
MLKEFHNITPTCIANRGIDGCVDEIGSRLYNYISKARETDGKNIIIRICFETVKNAKRKEI